MIKQEGSVLCGDDIDDDIRKCPKCGMENRIQKISVGFIQKCDECGNIDYFKEKGVGETSWENRVLCSDESCIGVIGKDGQCKICGKKGDVALPITECPRCGIIYEKAKRTTCTEETRETHGAVDKKLLDLCENAIIYRLGGLADIPPELANTVANVYLRFFYLFHPEGSINDIPALFDKLDLQVDIGEVWLNPSGILIETIDAFEYITESDPSLKKIRSYMGADPFTESMSINHLTRLKGLAEFRFINAIIGYLRILNDHPQQKKHTGMMVDLILDVFKYQIIRSVGKTSIRRKIERKLKKKKVFEIPNLIDSLDIRNLLKAKFFVTKEKLDEKDEEDITMDYLSPVGSFF